MKRQGENSLQITPDWKLFLESAKLLLKTGSLSEQSRLLLQTIDELFSVKARFWFAHPFYPLPGDEYQETVDGTSDLYPIINSTFSDHQPHFCLVDGQPVSKVSLRTPLAAASLPVCCDNDLLGILFLEKTKDNPISTQKISEIENFLSFCAMYLQIYRLNILKSWRVEQLSIVREISDRVTNIANLENLCAQITDTIREKFQYYSVAIFSREKDGDILCRSSASSVLSSGHSPSDDNLHGSRIVDWVADHREELIVEDVSRYAGYEYQESLPDTHSEVAIPLMIGERLLGILDVQSEKVQAFHEMDLLVLRTMADNIAIAIEESHLFASLNRRTEQMTTVFEISHALSSILDPDELLTEVVKTIQEKYRYLQVNVYTVHRGRGKIIFQAGTGERSREYREAYLTFNIQDKQGILPWVAREGKTFLSNNVTEEPQYRSPHFLHSTAMSEISVPLQAAGELVGILDIQSDRINAFDDNDTFFFEALSAGIANAIRNATLFRSEQFRRQVAESVRDIAGVLSNSSSLEELMDRILEKLQESLPCDAASIWLTSTDEGESNQLTLAAFRGIQPGRLIRGFHINAMGGQWIQDALKSEAPVIRSRFDSRGPLGEALNLPDDYSAIVAPLRAAGETVGLLTLAHHQPDRYGSESRLITQTFAGYAAAAIQNNRLYASVSEQAWVSTVLLKVAEANKDARSIDELTEGTARLIPELIGCSTCAVYFYNQPLKIYERKATCGFSQDAYPARTLPKDQPAFVFANSLLTPINAFYSHGDFLLTGRHDMPCGVILPLVIRNQNLGMIWVGNSDNRQSFDESILPVLMGISNQTATAIENLLLVENQQQDAFIAAALLQVAQTIVSQDDLPGILDSILRLLSILAGVETAAFFLESQDFTGYLPVTSSTGFTNEALRSVEASLFAGDFPLLDVVKENKTILLAPLSHHQKSFTQWTSIKRFYNQEDATGQKPQEGGWLIGIPLIAEEKTVGSMVVLEKPISGTLLEKRLDLLAGIGRQTAAAVANERIQDEKLEKEKLQQEFLFAREIQRTFLPRQLPAIKGWDVASLWQPANQVAGDFFDFFLSQPEAFYAVVADVSDKGMPAALYMTVTRTLIRSFAQENLSPGQILKKVNNLLLQDNPSGMFVTTAIIKGSRQSGILQYANAGHNQPLVFGRNTTPRELQKGEIALGILENQDYPDHAIEIQPDSFITLYTDGVTDTISPSGETYALKGLTRLILKTRLNKAANLAASLENDLMQFRAGLSCVDDITVLILHRL